MYEQFFGLSERPFEATPDPKFLFLSPNHLDVMNRMLSGVRDRQGPIIVMGEVGTGKTILVRSMLERLEEGIKSAFIFHTTVTFKELLKAIAVELDLPASGRNERTLWEQLIQYSKQLTDREETLAIIIDEAHKLDQAVIEQLLQRVMEPRSRNVQIILVGQPELEEKLGTLAVNRCRRSGVDRRRFYIPSYYPERRSGEDRREGLQQKGEVRLEIKPLDDDESKRYVEHRLRLSGAKASELFTGEALNLLSRESQGIPRVLNNLCDNALLTAYGLSRKKVDVDIVRETIRGLEGIPGKKVAGLLHALRTSVMKPSLRKGVIAGLILLCLAGIAIWLGRGSRQTTPDTSTRQIVRMSNPAASVPTSSPETEEKPQGASQLSSPPLETETPAAGTLPLTPSPPSPSIGTRGRTDVEMIVTVKAGQNIYKLCKQYYGVSNATLMDIVIDFNPDLENANVVSVNQKIRLPQMTEELLLLESPDHTYQIHAGTYTSPEDVVRYRNITALKEKEIEVVPRKVSPEETWYRVVIGRFGNRDEALEMIHLLERRRLVPSSGTIARKRPSGKTEAP